MSDPEEEVAVRWKPPVASAGVSAGFEELIGAVFESADVDREAWARWLADFSPTWYGWTPIALAERWQAVVEMMEVHPRTPINLEDRLQRLEGSVTQLSEALLSKPVVFSTKIVDLNSTDCSVQEPIPVVIEEYADESVATFAEVEAHGFGVTPAEAINDLKEQITELYDDLSTADADELGKLPTAWWRVLRHYVAKDEEIQQTRGS
jgi:hypothetical protein